MELRNSWIDETSSNLLTTTASPHTYTDWIFVVVCPTALEAGLGPLEMVGGCTLDEWNLSVDNADEESELLWTLITPLLPKPAVLEEKELPNARLGFWLPCEPMIWLIIRNSI